MFGDNIFPPSQLLNTIYHKSYVKDMGPCIKTPITSQIFEKEPYSDSNYQGPKFIS